ncbi:uncharacterized protein [Euphorbia lathyris]|uniref:uncharacterized protein n=1 Tax=Euphorbia lathyris TaxID=212925 RepID=UPI00331379E7
MPTKYKSHRHNAASINKRPDLSKRYGVPFPVFNHDEGRRYWSLRYTFFTGMLYMDEFLNNQLGITDDMSRYMERLGWTKFSQMRFPIIGDWILEFFCTVRFTNKRRVRLSFRQEGEIFTFGCPELHSWFCFPPRDTIKRHPGRDMTSSDIWRMLTGFWRFNSKLAYNHSFCSNSMLYLLKFMCHSLFGRTFSSVVRDTDLYVLGDIFQGNAVDSSKILMEGLVAASRSKDKKIGFGNIICGIILGSKGTIDVPWSDDEFFPTIDYEFLERKRLVKRVFRAGPQFLSAPNVKLSCSFKLIVLRPEISR